MKALYLEAFPASERKPESFIDTLAGRTDYDLFVLLEESVVQALGIVYTSPTGAFALLEYMAVSGALRGGGLGGQFLGQILERVGVPTVMEVEAEDWDAASAGLAERRKRFYRRLGCRAVDGLAYRMPQVSAAKPPPMELLLYGLDSAVIATATLRKWLEEIYRNVYARRTDDPAIAEMLEGKPDELKLI